MSCSFWQYSCTFWHLLWFVLSAIKYLTLESVFQSYLEGENVKCICVFHIHRNSVVLHKLIYTMHNEEERTSYIDFCFTGESKRRLLSKKRLETRNLQQSKEEIHQNCPVRQGNVGK